MSKSLVFAALAMLITCSHASRVNRAARRSSSNMEATLSHSDEETMVEDNHEASEEDHNDTEEGLEDEGSNSTDFSCKNYCVQCNDGSTVWYGRSKNWWKMGASTVLGGAGIAAAATGVGALGGAAIAGGAGALGYAKGVQAAEETHSHWSGNLPTSGFFCEKVDVIKFPATGNCFPAPFMEMSDKWFGRVKNNRLKPYDTNGKLMGSYAQSDMQSYKEGCKVVKAAGTKAFQQLSFGKFCKTGTTKGIHTCSAHSMLCGGAGVAGTNHAKSADQCQKQCSNPENQSPNQLKCPNKANGNQQPAPTYGNQPNQPYPGYNQQQNVGYNNQYPGAGYQQPGYNY